MKTNFATALIAVRSLSVLLALLRMDSVAWAREYHVSPAGGDTRAGTIVAPLQTISAAAAAARPGDVINIHAGVYRERIDPACGGTTDENRVVYQAAPGERVVIKGSERITGWQRVGHSTWKVSLPNSFFGEFNPYSDRIHGDWFQGKGREHHTGAVYLNDHWLTEAAQIDEVLAPLGETPLWFGSVDESTTTLWAQFADVDPNQAAVEINVRQSIFYPSREGMNYITVCGLVMMHAATPWAPPAQAETHALIVADTQPDIKVTQSQNDLDVQITLIRDWGEQAQTELVTTQRLGTAVIPSLPYVQPDAATYRIDTDFFGNPRNVEHPSPGPFEIFQDGQQTLKVWP